MKKVLVFLLFLLPTSGVLAQHEGHDMGAMKMPADTIPPKKAAPKTGPMKGMKPEGLSHDGSGMSHAFSLSLPMNRNGSGTGWLPDSTPLYAYMKHTPKWMLMLHGSVFLGVTTQNFNNPTKRGEKQVSAPNWAMSMAQRRVGKNGLFLARLMVSLDPLTVGRGGYPLLFQTGESYHNQPLTDRQHPHDLISELALGYTQRLNAKTDVSLYLGYPGEPALGPTAFMHRISTMNNPDATLGHHWQDATHITFGVATLGVRLGKFKLEGSSFTGREPNEHRYDFDRPRFDSYSGRLSFAPSVNWTAQVSRGFIKSPEDLHPDENVTRTTASVLHSLPLGGHNRSWTSAVVWGMNEQQSHSAEHSVLAETNLQLDRWAVYGRYEFVQKSAGELGGPVPGELFSGESRLFNVNAFTLGINRQIAYVANTLLSVGAQATAHAPDRALEPVYGKMPLSAHVYLRLMPGLLRMNH